MSLISFAIESHDTREAHELNSSKARLHDLILTILHYDLAVPDDLMVSVEGMTFTLRSDFLGYGLCVKNVCDGWLKIGSVASLGGFIKQGLVKIEPSA